MKRILCLLITLLACQLTWASDFAVENSDGLTIYYNKLSDTEVEVTYGGSSYYYSAYSGSVLIPTTVTYSDITYSVTSIGNSAFYKSSLTSMTIPNSVTVIGEEAFYYCKNMTSITLGNSVTSIGMEAFMGCSALTQIDLPNSTISIGEKAFLECTGLTQATLGNSLQSIGNDAFYGCNALTAISLPSTLQSIGNKAFYACKGLTSIIIPDSVTELGYSAFSNCYHLKEVVLSNSLTLIPYGTFSYCAITSITIPNTVTSIGTNAFEHCSSLTSVTIPDAVTSLGDGSFKYCSLLTSVTIPNSVTYVGRYAFSMCEGLISVTIGNSVTEIGDYAFEYCGVLTSIYALPTTPPTCGDLAFTAKGIYYGTCILYVPNESIEDYKTADQWKEFRNITGLVESISLNKSTLDLNIGTSEQLTVDIDKTVTWTSSNDEVATVDQDGNVTAVGVGTATITASYGDVSATCAVTVNPIVATSVTLDKTELELTIGSSETLIAMVSPDNTTDSSITWTSSNDEVATVDAEGNVTAIAVGSATITATCGSVSATCAVSVKNYTGIENVSGDSFDIHVEDGNLVIEGLTDDAPVHLFTVDGKLVYSGYERRITLQAGEVYIVAYPGGSRKIAL